MIELSRCKDLKDSFDTFYHNRLKADIEDARDRVNMVVADAVERESRDLSALPSTKSASIVDGFVENAIQTYTQDPDAISLTPRNLSDQQADGACRLLTQNFIYRADTTADWIVTLESLIRAGATDGMTCAMASWVKESYSEKVPQYQELAITGDWLPIDEETYLTNKPYFPESFKKTTVDQKFVTRDTWVVDNLMLGRDVFYDPSIRVMNINRGQFAGVVLKKSVDDILAYQELGVFKKTDSEGNAFGREEIENYQKSGADISPSKYFTDKKDDIDLQDKNLVSLCVFFYKDKGCWKVQFSLDWKAELTDWQKVNDVFFNGRPVNLLPIVIGYSQSALWEAVGVGMPHKIAPIEDELSDHRNNSNDIAKQMAQGGRIRVSPDTDVNIDQVINARVFKAEKDEVEFVQYQTGILESMRMDDARNQDIAALVPVSSSDRARQLAGKGTTRTLGMSQMLEQDANAKLGVHITLYNATFMKPLINLITQLTIAYETDSQVMAMAAQKAGIKLPAVNGVIDWKFLDVAFDVQINAGLGSTPRYKKAAVLQEMAAFRKTYDVPTDYMEIAAQMNTLAGFTPETFFPKEPPPPPPKPPVEYKLNVNMDLSQMPEEGQEFLLNKMMNEGMDISAKVDGKNPQAKAEAKLREAANNGGGMNTPERDSVDATGDAAMGMSQGGMQS